MNKFNLEESIESSIKRALNDLTFELSPEFSGKLQVKRHGEINFQALPLLYIVEISKGPNFLWLFPTVELSYVAAVSCPITFPMVIKGFYFDCRAAEKLEKTLEEYATKHKIGYEIKEAKQLRKRVFFS